MKKDKAKVLDEVWDDNRVRSFLDTPGVDGPAAMVSGVDPDHACLLRAYRSMRPADFSRFLALFTAAGRSLDATDADGQRLADILAGHRHGTPYLAALAEAGAAP